MIKLRSLWNIPARGDADAADRVLRGRHTDIVRMLPAVRRHLLLRFISNARGGHPGWYRGEELWFETAEEAVAVRADYARTPLWDLVSGPRTELLRIEDTFDAPGADPSVPSDGAEITCLTGLWQVPPGSSTEDADAVYFTRHVPGVRALPLLVRHTVMKALPWPPGEHARFWRSAEIRFASRDDFEATFRSPAYDKIRVDGFNAAVVGPEVDIFAIEEEWVTSS